MGEPRAATAGRPSRLASVLLAFVIGVPLGCRRVGHPPQPGPTSQPIATTALATTRPALAGSPTSAPATAPSQAITSRSFTSEGAGLKLSYPSNWKQKTSSDDVLLLIPVQGPESRNVSLDEPALPPHIPGMIPMHPAHQDYLNDMKKKHAGLKVEEDQEHALPGAKGRLVHCSWVSQGDVFDEVMLLLIHGDHVFLLSLDTERDAYRSARSDFDQICNSLQWTK